MESKAIISERGAAACLDDINQLLADLVSHASQGLEAHSDTRLLVLTPYLDNQGKVVTPDTLRFRTVSSTGAVVVVDVPIVLLSGQAVTNLTAAPPPPDAPQSSVLPESSSTSAGGCFLKSTMISMAGGGEKPIEAIVVGDKLASFRLDGLGLEETAWAGWRTANLNLSQEETTVTQVMRSNFTRYYVLQFDDGTALHVTFEHLVLFMRDWVWQIDHASKLKAGDEVYSPTGHKKIVTKAELFAAVETFNLDVEPHDLYLANGVLVHNSSDVTK